MKKYYVITTILIVIALLVISLVTLINNEANVIDENQKRFTKEENFADGIECRVLDNTSEKIRTAVIIKKAAGIDKIEYIAESGENVILNCNGKQRLIIDYEMEIDKEYQFKVVSNGIDTIEKISLAQNYINDYIVITKFDNAEELKFNQVNAEFKYYDDTFKKYYKIGAGPWTEYSQDIELQLADIPLDNLNNDIYETTVYAKMEDEAGNTIQASKTVEITKTENLYEKFDLFENIMVSTNNTASYGMVCNPSSGASAKLWQMGSSHYSGTGGHNTTFTLPWNIYKNMAISSLYVKYSFDGNRWNTSKATVVINYTDATSSTTNITNQATIEIDKDKEIENIQFQTSGSDSGPGGTAAYAIDIKFNNVEIK